MRTVWILTTGSYSDYSIYGVCNTLDECTRVMTAIPNNDWNEPAEYVVNAMVDLVDRGYKAYSIHLCGDTYDVSVSDPSHDGNYLFLRDCKRTECDWARINAKSEKQALKIFTEKRAHMIANNLLRLEW